MRTLADGVFMVPGGTIPKSSGRAKRRILVTGQVGLDKTDLLLEVANYAAKAWSERTLIFSVGEAMYGRAPWIVRGRILYQDRHMLDVLASAVMMEAVHLADSFDGTVIVNTHATFSWHTGAFKAHRIGDLGHFAPDVHLTVVDNVYCVAQRFQSGNHQYPLGIKDLIAWRDRETMEAQTFAEALHGSHFGRHFVVARGPHNGADLAIETIANLIYRPNRTLLYPSFPMTHVYDMPEVLADINAFRRALAAKATIFNPADVDEKIFLLEAEKANSAGTEQFTFNVCGTDMSFRVQDVLGIAGDIDGQIIGRDYQLIDQSEAVVSYIPELPGAPNYKYGIPGLSSGVERELDYAFSHTKPVYVVWRPMKPPSPFMAHQATKILPTVNEMLSYLRAEGLLR